MYGDLRGGSFAEYATARQDRLALKPANLSFEQAAAAPISGLTALQGLRDCGRVWAGQRVLVIGAAGGVGSFAVQIAKAFGATVTGVCSTAKVDLVGSLGADDVIDYTRSDFDGNGPVRPHHRHGGQPSAVPAAAGPDAARNPGPCRRRAGGGRLARRLRPTDAARTAPVPLRQPAPAQPMAKEHAADLEELRRLIDSGAVTPVIDRAYPLADAADAIRHLAQGHAAGKTVVTV